MDVYLLFHTRQGEGGYEDVKLIGAYSSLAKAEATLERYKHIRGFREQPQNLEITECTLDKDHFEEGFGEFADPGADLNSATDLSPDETSTVKETD